MWPAAFMTSHMLIVRVRQVAEHASVPDLFDPDPRKNTRTTYVNWLQRLLLCPHDLNYHVEHHFLASVPIYRLRKMHGFLQDRGFYSDTHFPKGYLTMLREVTVPG
jgi:fatty acid desaturase